MRFPMIHRSHLWLGLAGAGLVLATLGFAQAPSASSSPATASPDSQEGKDIGGFHVTQSIEIGGRINATTGSEAMYDTLVNYQSGARILDQSLTMQAKDHEEIFDTLTLSSFGWGGDPEQAARLRIAKYRWYNFSGSYQHMQNYFDYDLLANPLNPAPPAGNPAVPVLFSPHSYFDRQNLYNFDLVVLPMHKLSFRAGYNRNRIIGPAFNSQHEGTDALLYQDWNNQLNGFRFGADWRANDKTTISYTQLLQYYTGGTNYSLNPYNSWQLSNGSFVSFGLPWFNSGSPCSAPLKNGLANPSCNGYFNYSLYQHEHTFIPTEQLNVRSTSLKWLDFNGQWQYSHAQMNTPLTAIYSGLTTRTGLLGYNTAGSSSSAKWNSSSADVSGTIYISERLRLVEAFHFRNFSVAGNFLDFENSFFPAAPTTASLLTPVAYFPGNTLTHTTASPADIVNDLYANLLGQSSYTNDFQAQYDLTSSFGVRAGFNWTQLNIQPGDSYEAALGDIYYPNNPNRGECAGQPLNANGSCTFTGVLTPWDDPVSTATQLNRYTGVLGAWYRKGSLHTDVSAEYGAADNWIYRIDPLNFFNFRGNVSYAPRPWLMMGGYFTYQKASNNTPGINLGQHNYTTMVNATIMPNKKWGIDLAYNFDAIQQDLFLCFQDSTPPAGSTTCAGDSSLLQTFGVYQTHTQYGYIALTLSPLERVNMRVGYSMVDNQGNTTDFNALLPLGPLSSTYQTPLATVDVKLYKNVSFKGGWNYYQYGEGSFVGPTAPRYFHANNTTLAVQYAF
jgi:hypothetical protein